MKYELLLEFVQDTYLEKPYTLTLRPINKQQTTSNGWATIKLN